MDDEEKLRILKLPIKVFYNGKTEMMAKFEKNSDNGYFVPGNDWVQFWKDGLICETNAMELLEEGWKVNRSRNICN